MADFNRSLTNQESILNAPAAPSGEPLRIAIPLANTRGDSVEISVRLDPAGKPALVDWRGLKMSIPRGIVDDR